MDKENVSIVERFVGFCPLATADAASIVDMLTHFLAELGLSLFDCRGQAYDGASVMAGHVSGVQARIKEIEPKAHFTHCYGHALNLAIVGACSNTYVRNMFNILDKLHSFFNGSKRKAILDECIEVHPALSSIDKKRSLQSLSDTRWSCRYKALKSFEVNEVYTLNIVLNIK